MSDPGPEQEQTRLEFDIYGINFRLKAPPEEHERLKRAARHVDNVMREIVVSQPTANTARLVMQAAFLITTDYMKLLDDIASQHGTTDNLKRRVDELLQRLDDSLSSI